MAAGVERHADHPLVAEGPAQLLPVRLGEVVDVPHAGLGQRRCLDAVGEDGPERDEVGVDARVRLDVGVRCAEQRLGVVGGERLDGVDVLAAGVEPVADGALGVLVAEPGAHGQQHGGRGVVLAGDQLQRLALIGQLGSHRLGDGRLGRTDHGQRVLVRQRRRGGRRGVGRRHLSCPAGRGRAARRRRAR